MIAWLNPAALAGLGALAIPVLIHLLRQHRAARVLFPSLRFVHPSHTAAVRLRRVSDPWLLLVRLTALALAACALAQPVVLTPARLAAWNARTARAIVIDTSDSMARSGAARAAMEAADAEAASAFAVRRFETADLRAGVEQAAAWLAAAPPATREVVILSDFQHGALTRADLAEVPDTAGVRAVQVGTPPASRQFEGVPLLRQGTGSRRTEIQLGPSTTQLSITASPEEHSGLRLLTAAEEAGAAHTLLRTLAAAGTPAPAAAQPIAAAFTGSQPPAAVRAIGAGWMLGTVVRLMADPDLHAATARASAPDAEDQAGPWTTVARDAQQRPLVRAAAAGPELVLDIAGTPGTYLAAAAVRGVLLARHPPSVYAEQEIVRTAADDLARWTRAPDPVDAAVAVHAERTDARWFWILALLMLGIEMLMRQPRRAAAEEAQADAA